MQTIVRPDSKGRISLGKYAKGVSSFVLEMGRDHQIVLKPQVEILAREKWLFENSAALRSVIAGIEQAKQGKTKKRGSFSKYAEDELD